MGIEKWMTNFKHQENTFLPLHPAATSVQHLSPLLIATTRFHCITHSLPRPCGEQQAAQFWSVLRVTFYSSALAWEPPWATVPLGCLCSNAGPPWVTAPPGGVLPAARSLLQVCPQQHPLLCASSLLFLHTYLIPLIFIFFNPTIKCKPLLKGFHSCSMNCPLPVLLPLPGLERSPCSAEELNDSPEKDWQSQALR